MKEKITIEAGYLNDDKNSRFVSFPQSMFDVAYKAHSREKRSIIRLETRDETMCCAAICLSLVDPLDIDEVMLDAECLRDTNLMPYVEENI